MTTPARVVAWLRALLGCSRAREHPSRHHPPATPRWIDVPVRALTAEELRADPHQARVVRRRWLDRHPSRAMDTHKETTTMEQTNAILEQAARRYTGIIGRLSPKARRGYILAATGETLPFHRNQVMGHSDPHPWRPRVGAKVLFDRELRPRGPWAVKVRPIGVV